MPATQSDIRSKIEELKLSYAGYNRQLNRPYITGERRQRLQSETGLLEEEIATLEKIAHLDRLEPEKAKVEQAVRERLNALRERMQADPTLAALSTEQRDQSSGEARALLWALGEDSMTRNVRMLMEGHERSDPSRTDRALPAILMSMLEQGPNPEARASAAYELGKLKITQAIPKLVEALDDQPIIAEMALRSLSIFSHEQLQQAMVSEQVILRVKSTHIRD